MGRKRITLLCLGSRGDVLPYLALGGRMVQAGYPVTAITFENFAPLARRFALDFLPLRGDAEVLVQTAGANLWRLVASFSRAAQVLQEDIAGAEDAIASSGLLLNQLPGGVFGGELAERHGMPMALVAVIPLVPTAAFPSLGLPREPRFIPGYNKLSYILAEQLLWFLLGKNINRWRVRSLGLNPLPAFRPLTTRHSLPALLGFSPQVVPPPPDWGPNVALTGWWQPQDLEWKPPPGLEKFLDGGPPPVFAGFGSMPLKDPAATARVVIQAARQAGQRLVLHSGWGGLRAQDLPPEVFSLDYAPYEWLFPRMAGLVIHGGSGTTGYAARSGVPALVVPFLYDQHDWGRRLAGLGAAAPNLPIRQLTQGRLAERIHLLVTSAELRQGAARLGELVRQEDGLGKAEEILRGLLGDR
jgi:sterol 3beta-glucosyltransferase